MIIVKKQKNISIYESNNFLVNKSDYQWFLYDNNKFLKDKNLDKKDIFFLIYDTVLFFFQDKYIKGTDSDLRLYRIYYILSNMKRNLDDKEKYKDFHIKLKEYRDFLISSTNITTYMINIDDILFEIDDIVLKEKIASQILGEILSYRIDKDDTESAVIHLKKITLEIYKILNTTNISFNKKTYLKKRLSIIQNSI